AFEDFGRRDHARSLHMENRIYEYPYVLGKPKFFEAQVCGEERPEARGFSWTLHGHPLHYCAGLSATHHPPVEDRTLDGPCQGSHQTH
ncbi:hypothetical protein SB766_27825, partial [Pseudomonas sp. SIMBA_077]